MAYQLLIPPGLAAAYAAGEVGLMATAAGATTTLVGGSGAIVGTATLVETAGASAAVVSGGGAAAGATTAAVSATALALPVALAVGGLLIAGGGAWYAVHRIRQARRADDEPVVIELADGVDPEEALREAQAIVDLEYERLIDRDSSSTPVVQLREA